MLIPGHCVSFEQNVGDLTLVLPRTIEEISNNLRVFFIGKNIQSYTKIPLINSVDRKKVLAALNFLKSNNPNYSDVVINKEVFESNGFEPGCIKIDGIENQTLQDMLNAVDAHDYLDIDIVDEEVRMKAESDPNSLSKMDMQTSCLVTVSLADYGLEKIVLRASLNTWFKMSKQGDLFTSVHDDHLKCTYESLDWFPSMYPLLFPLGITGPDFKHREVYVSIEEYVKHQISIKDRRFATHDTFMFAMYNIIQRRNVSKSLRFAIRGKDMFKITVEDLTESLQQLLTEGNVSNIQVQRLFNKVRCFQLI